MTGAEAAGAHAAAPATPGGGFDAGPYILHHILDANTIEIPWSGKEIHLPTLHLGSFELPITRNVVMMWVASAILVVLFTLAARRAKEPVPRGLRNVLPQFQPEADTWQWPVGGLTLRFRLDHILADQHFRALGAAVVDAGRSDHAPVWADLEYLP